MERPAGRKFWEFGDIVEWISIHINPKNMDDRGPHYAAMWWYAMAEATDMAEAFKVKDWAYLVLHGMEKAEPSDVTEELQDAAAAEDPDTDKRIEQSLWDHFGVKGN